MDARAGKETQSAANWPGRRLVVGDRSTSPWIGTGTKEAWDGVHDVDGCERHPQGADQVNMRRGAAALSGTEETTNSLEKPDGLQEPFGGVRLQGNLRHSWLAACRRDESGRSRLLGRRGRFCGRSLAMPHCGGAPAAGLIKTLGGRAGQAAVGRFP